MRVLLEGALRNLDGFLIREEDVRTIAGWTADGERGRFPSALAVILQDFTGVPAVVDLAALRDAMVEMGGDAERVNPRCPWIWSSITPFRWTCPVPTLTRST